MKIGLVGLPNSGKTTLFNAITQSKAEAANYQFSTKVPNVAQIPVPDERLDFLQNLYNSKKLINATVELVDIAGLVEGAGSGEGMGNLFLSHIREVDAIAHVLGAFSDSNAMRVYSDVNLVRDAEIINLELILADLDIVERRLSRIAKSQDKSLKPEIEALNILQDALQNEIPAREVIKSDYAKIISGMNLLTAKPMFYAANIDESDLGKNSLEIEVLKPLYKIIDSEKVFVICAKIEEEISSLDGEEKTLFLKDFGLDSGGADRLIKAGYAALGLISFLTAGPKEVRAWTVRAGAKAPEAAGKIHSDLERGFIRAEVVKYEDLYAAGSYQKAKENGKVRVEGKEYEIKDGDVVLIRFNV